MSGKATHCKVCKGQPDPKLGSYCRPCYNREAYIKKHGTDEGYKPYNQRAAECAECEHEIKRRHPNFRSLCHDCGVKRHGAYQKTRRAQQRKPNNPIVVKPKTHRAPGQAMAPPAPKIEVKPEPVVIPPGKEPRRIPLHISRWEHGGDDLWTPKESQTTY